MCEKLELNDHVDVNTLLLKAKSLYHIYTRELTLLKMQKHQLEVKDFRLKHSSCLEKAKRVVLILGSLFDKGELENDDEGRKLLDLSMIDYAYETNDLQSCKRCFLCRKWVKKLLRSHTWPRSILKSFSRGVELPVTKRSLLVSWHSQEQYFSANEVTFFLFCKSCEALLSEHGESQFLPGFFESIYDLSLDNTKAKDICYGEWLYQFCVGIIFRGLIQQNMTKFVIRMKFISCWLFVVNICLVYLAPESKVLRQKTFLIILYTLLLAQWKLRVKMVLLIEC